MKRRSVFVASFRGNSAVSAATMLILGAMRYIAPQPSSRRPSELVEAPECEALEPRPAGHGICWRFDRLSANGFGISTHGFGISTHGFGISTHGFGVSTHGFGVSTPR